MLHLPRAIFMLNALPLLNSRARHQQRRGNKHYKRHGGSGMAMAINIVRSWHQHSILA